MFRTLGLISLALIFFTGCAFLGQPGPTTRVRPVSAGIDLDVQKLMRSGESYRTSYSGPVNNPSALLFVPRQGEDRLKLDRGWKAIDSRKRMSHLQRSLDSLDAKLWAIVPSSRKEVSSQDVLAYIYTPGYASVQRIRNEERYLILPVPEQFNPRYHGNGNGEASQSE